MKVESRNIEVVDDDVASILAGKSPDEKLRIAAGLRKLARSIIEANVKYEHCNWTEKQIQAEVNRRLLGGTIPGADSAD